MAKSPITKTANIVLPLAGLGILIGVGFLVFNRFFKGETQEQRDEQEVRQQKGALQNTLDFIFGEGTSEEQTQDVTPNPQTTNTTSGLNGNDSGDFFGNLFGSIARFFNPVQEGQSSPTIETKATDSTPSTTDAGGSSTARDTPPPPPVIIIPPTGGNTKRGVTQLAPGFKQLPPGQTLRELQIITQAFGQPPKRGGRIAFGSSAQGQSPGNTTSNADTSTQRKSTPSTKDITEQQQQTSNTKEFSARLTNRPTRVGTSNTSPKSSGSPTSSTATSEKTTTPTPSGSARGTGNRRTTNSGTGTTDKTQTTPPITRNLSRRRGNIRR